MSKPSIYLSGYEQKQKLVKKNLLSKELSLDNASIASKILNSTPQFSFVKMKEIIQSFELNCHFLHVIHIITSLFCESSITHR